MSEAVPSPARRYSYPLLTCAATESGVFASGGPTGQGDRIANKTRNLLDCKKSALCMQYMIIGIIMY